MLRSRCITSMSSFDLKPLLFCTWPSSNSGAWLHKKWCLVLTITTSAPFINCWEMTQVPKKLLVLGGTGFVGREICRRAVKVGLKVTSLRYIFDFRQFPGYKCAYFFYSRRGRIPTTHLSADDVVSRVCCDRERFCIGHLGESRRLAERKCHS